MWSSNRTISAGDTVIIWMTRDNLEPLTITPNAILHNKFGVFPHNSLLGLPYGSKVRSSAPSNSGRRGESNTGGGFLYVLRPTPELWTLALPHRTQILYIADISFVVAHLGIGPGKRVVEAGTGSGSFSHSVARTVGNQGKLYTFEFHEQRAIKAQAEFEKHGLSVPATALDGGEGEGGEEGEGRTGIVRLQHRNVCKDGFGSDLEEREEVDAVFLDLPAPWEAVGWATKVMRKDWVSRICCFSPCIEQVIRTVTALNDAGFSEITMFETLLRPMDVTSTPSLPSINDVTARLKAAEVKREDKRLRQIAQNREREAKEAKEAFARGEVLASSVKRKQEDGDEAKGGDEGEVEKKRVKTSNGVGEIQVDGDLPAIPVISTTQITLSQILAPTSTSASFPAASSTPALPSATPTPAPTTTPAPVPSPSPFPKPPAGKISVSKALPEVRGHTSYLTFATLVPYAYAKKLKLKGGEAARASQETTKKNRVAEVPQSENQNLEAAVPGPRGSASVSHATSAEPEEKATGST